MSAYVVISLSDAISNSLGYVSGFEPWTELVARARLVSVGPGPMEAEKEVRSERPNIAVLGVFSLRVKSNDVRSARLSAERPSAKAKLPLPVLIRPASSGPPLPY
jgi:hypothetical protein